MMRLFATAVPALCFAAGLPVPDGLIIDGDAVQPMSLSAAELASHPHVTVKRLDHGHEVECAGVPLAQVLGRAGLPSGEALRGRALTNVLRVTARDGYAVVLTLGELDGTLGDADAIIADQCEGKRLSDETGPLRLVLPKDQRPARSVRQLERIRVIDKI